MSLSFRGQVYANNTFYGLKDKPPTSMNLLHVSRSPMEALFDRLGNFNVLRCYFYVSIFFISPAVLDEGFHDIHGFIRRKVASTEGIPCDHLPDSSMAS